MRNLYHDIKVILLTIWDPFNIGEEPQAENEYDAYVALVHDFIQNERELSKIRDYLLFIEEEYLSLTIYEDDIERSEKAAILLSRVFDETSDDSLDKKVSDDIVKKIIRKNQDLRVKYYEALDDFTDGHVEAANLGTKLHSLSMSLSSQLQDDTLKPQTLIDVLDAMEEYVLYLEDEDEKGVVEVMFFEGLLNVIQDIDNDSPLYKHARLFKSNLGPACEELCEKNNKFWHELMNNKK